MRKLGLLVLALGLAACSNDSTAPSTTVEGSYSLRTVNGTTLPYTFSNGQQLVSEQLVLNADGTFSDASQYNNGTQVDTGYWTNLNGSITFTDVTANNLTYQGSLSGTVLTEIVNGYTQTFQKN